MTVGDGETFALGLGFGVIADAGDGDGVAAGVGEGLLCARGASDFASRLPSCAAMDEDARMMIARAIGKIFLIMFAAICDVQLVIWQ